MTPSNQKPPETPFAFVPPISGPLHGANPIYGACGLLASNTGPLHGLAPCEPLHQAGLQALRHWREMERESAARPKPFAGIGEIIASVVGAAR